MAAPRKAERMRLAKEGKAQKDGSYPTNTPGRARAAKAYAERFASPAKRARIDAQADRELGKGKKGK